MSEVGTKASYISAAGYHIKAKQGLCRKGWTVWALIYEATALTENWGGRLQPISQPAETNRQTILRLMWSTVLRSMFWTEIQFEFGFQLTWVMDWSWFWQCLSRSGPLAQIPAYMLLPEFFSPTYVTSLWDTVILKIVFCTQRCISSCGVTKGYIGWKNHLLPPWTSQQRQGEEHTDRRNVRKKKIMKRPFGICITLLQVNMRASFILLHIHSLDVEHPSTRTHD